MTLTRDILLMAGTSFLFFGLSLLLLIGLTFFESALVGMSQAAERTLSSFLLVIPAAIGAGLAGLSLARREGFTWLAILSIILNALFALFHLMILLFAG